MPKVNKDYFENKRALIIEAAFRVSERKAVSAMTMQDVIDESGLSQGGIYRFFENIDAIFAAMIEKTRERDKFERDYDEVVQKNLSLTENFRLIFDMIKENYRRNSFSLIRFSLEMDLLILSNPERAKKIRTMCKVENPYTTLTRITTEVLFTAEAEGAIKPRIPIMNVIAFIVTAFDGIALDSSIAQRSDNTNPLKKRLNTDELIDTLFITVQYLLGLENENEQKA